MAYESELAQKLVPYTAGEQPKGLTRLIKLNTNENPYPPSPRVAEALNGKTDLLRLYPDMETTSLCQAIASVNGVRPEQVFCGNGSDEVLAFAFAAFFAGKTVLAPEITYSFYPVYSQLFDVHYQTIPLKDDYTVDVDALLTGAPVALCNPNAPTGIMLPITEVERIATVCRDAGSVLLVDEAYAAFAPENALPLLANYDNILIVRTFSKSHSLAGLRVGYCIGSERLISAMKRIRDSFNSYPVDRLAQLAAQASVLDTAYVDEKVRLIVKARDNCYSALCKAGIPVLRSATNFLFVQGDPVDASGVQKALRAQGIIVRHFSAPKLAPWLRVTIGTEAQMEIVTEALIRLIRK